MPVRSSNHVLTSAFLARNAIFAELPESCSEKIVAQGVIVDLELRDQIYAPDEPIDFVYFPIDSVLSIVTRMRDGAEIEVGTIGREGMSALPLLFGATTTANHCYCQVRGSAVRLTVTLFEELVATSAALRRALDRYLQAYVNMLGQLAACNRLHTVFERCARWLLMTHDRVGNDTFELTHEFLAMMLGTGRSGVTIAAATLKRAGFIAYAHGTITMVDRAGLEGATCECYEVACVQFAGLFRPPHDPLPGGTVPRFDDAESLVARRIGL